MRPDAERRRAASRGLPNGRAHRGRTPVRHATPTPPAAPLARRDFSVIVPAYDEAENVAALFAALRAAFDRHALDGEVVFVDDGSADGTRAAALAEAAHFGGRVRVLGHRRNRGKTEAIVLGAEAAAGAYLVVLDADLQYAPDEIPRFLDALDAGWDLVTARKVGAYQKPHVSRAYNWLSRRLFALPVRDCNSMKAMRREVLAAVPARHDWHRYLVAIATACGHSVTELDVAIRPRHAGRSKYTGAGRVLGGALDLLAVWFYLRFSLRPMQLFGGAGLALAAAGGLLGTALVVLRTLRVPPPAIGYRPLLALVALLVTVGVVLVGVGLLAELMAALRAEVAELRRREARGAASHAAR